MGSHSNTTEPLPYLCASSSGVRLHSVASLHLPKHLYARVSPKFACNVCLKWWDLDYDSVLYTLVGYHTALYMSAVS